MEGDTPEDIDFCRNLGLKDKASIGACEKHKYVNAYAVTKQYGGPEEGGWWYNEGTPIASIPAYTPEDVNEAKKYLERLRGQIEYGKISSVSGGVRFDILTEEKKARKFPSHKPYYE